MHYRQPGGQFHAQVNPEGPPQEGADELLPDEIEEIAENFLLTLVEPHFGHSTFSEDLNTSLLNSCPQSSHLYSNIGI